MVPRGLSAEFDEALVQFTTAVPPLASFIHLHAGIDATDLPTYESDHNMCVQCSYEYIGSMTQVCLSRSTGAMGGGAGLGSAGGR